jgi:hypothetical protein
MRQLLGETTSAPDSALYSLQRVSAEEPEKWKNELTPAQIETVADVISRFRLRFYRDFA